VEKKSANVPAEINGKERDLRKIRYTMPIVRSRRPNGERSARQMLISTATEKVIPTMIKGTVSYNHPGTQKQKSVNYRTLYQIL
jgi:hypothetical protein